MRVRRTPDPLPTDPLTPADLRRLAAALDEAALTRRQQLAQLPEADDDQVAAAQRAALEQTVAEIDAARRLVDEGGFGTCRGCSRPISLARLEHRPWSTACIECASRWAS